MELLWLLLHSLYACSCGSMRKRHQGLTLRWYRQFFAYCYPVSEFFSRPTKNCQTSDIGRNCDLADEVGGSGSTSGYGPNCGPQGLDDRPRGLPNLEKTRKDTLNKNARQSHNKRPSSEGRFSFGWPLFAQRPSDQGNTLDLLATRILIILRTHNLARVAFKSNRRFPALRS